MVLQLFHLQDFRESLQGLHRGVDGIAGFLAAQKLGTSPYSFVVAARVR